MALTDPEKVGKIVKINPKNDVAPFIEAAAYLVGRVCATAVIVGTDPPEPFYTNEELELIERWLAAHFYCVFDSRSLNEQVSSLRIQYQSKVDLGLDVTHYGQQAKVLDVNGGLAALDNLTTGDAALRKLKGGVRWLGTPNQDVYGR